jgi:hypothetical protein
VFFQIVFGRTEPHPTISPSSATITNAKNSCWRGQCPSQQPLSRCHLRGGVADLEGQARRIFAHCGLPWDDRCLCSTRPTGRCALQGATQVRQPIYKTAIARWSVDVSGISVRS